MNNFQDKRVFLALSGGVDSSVAGALLLQQGYQVTAVFMKNWSDSKNVRGECLWRDDEREARKVAVHLGIDCIQFDFEKEYKKQVGEYLFTEYAKGRTPNPDILCNKYIKFGLFLDQARSMGADWIATGHYAQTHEGRLFRSVDETKDQTYFLHMLGKQKLAATLFPIGSYTKSQVREKAVEFGLPNAHRKESMGICFVGEMNMKEFLQERLPVSRGKIVTTAKEEIGEHDGVWFYTIGQRHGFGGGGGKPYFIVEKDLINNILVVGHGNDPRLYAKRLLVADWHWISGSAPSLPLNGLLRIRHRQPLQEVVIREGRQEGIYECLCIEPQRAVTPGQFAVIYQGGECLGGGVISYAASV